MRFPTLRFLLIPIALTTLLVFGQGPAWAQSPEALDDVQPLNHQDSVNLTRLTSGIMPPDGLLSVALGGRQSSTVFIFDEFLGRVNQLDYFLQAEASLLPWMALGAELPFRTWSNGQDWVPESGSGLADGSWQITLGRSLWLGGALHGSLFGGGNLPLGSEAIGLAEGAFSPHAGAALTFRFWSDSNVPEMRLHLNVGRRWNRQEEDGYGMGSQGFQPWPSRYPAANQVGGLSATFKQCLMCVYQVTELHCRALIDIF